MSFVADLTNYFSVNTDVACEAMNGNGLDGYFPYKSKEYKPSDFEIWAEPQGITQQQVEEYGGEDMGPAYYSTYKFSKEGEKDVFLKFYGWYASYDGANYEGFKQVYPKEVTRIEYV